MDGNPPGAEFENVPVVVSQVNPLVAAYNVTDLLIEGISFKHASSDTYKNLDFGNEAALRISESSRGGNINDVRRGTSEIAKAMYS